MATYTNEIGGKFASRRICDCLPGHAWPLTDGAEVIWPDIVWTATGGGDETPVGADEARKFYATLHKMADAFDQSGDPELIACAERLRAETKKYERRFLKAAL